MSRLPSAGGAGRQGGCGRRDRLLGRRRLRRRRGGEGRRRAGGDGRRGARLRLQPVRHHRNQPREPRSPLPRRQPQVSTLASMPRVMPPRLTQTAQAESCWAFIGTLPATSTIGRFCILRSTASKLAWHSQTRHVVGSSLCWLKRSCAPWRRQKEAAAEGAGGGGAAAGAARGAVHGAAPRPRRLPWQRPAAAGCAAPAVVPPTLTSFSRCSPADLFAV